MSTHEDIIQRLADHMGYCPHSTPEDERAGLAILDLARRVEAAERKHAEAERAKVELREVLTETRHWIKTNAVDISTVRALVLGWIDAALAREAAATEEPACEECNGSGHDCSGEYAMSLPCPACNGSGRVPAGVQTPEPMTAEQAHAYAARPTPRMTTDPMHGPHPFYEGVQTPEEMEARADELTAYYNSLPDGVSSEAINEAHLLRAEAARLRKAQTPEETTQ